MAGKLKKEKQKVYLSPGNLKRKMIPRIFFMSYLGINVIALTGIPVYASDIFATAKNAMQTVYTDCLVYFPTQHLLHLQPVVLKQQIISWLHGARCLEGK